MLFSPEKYNRIIPDVNEELLRIQGEMDDKEAQITLAKFLRFNLGLAVDWIAGFKMPAYQQIALKAFFLRNFNLCVWGRGCAKCVDYQGLTYVIEKNKGLILLKELLPNIDFTQGDRWQDIKELKLWNGKSW